MAKAPATHTRTPLSRRHLLRGSSGVAVALPWLEAMQSAGAGATTPPAESPRRFMACCATLGFHAPFLFPDNSDTRHTATPYMKALQPIHDQVTLLSGLSHPDQQGNNGHASELTWLTSARRPGLAGFRNSISIDQLIAARVGQETRHPFLALSTSGRSMSWSSSGVEIPAQTSPSKLFQELFTESSSEQKQQRQREIQRHRSILDTLTARSRRLKTTISVRDREKLDEYLTAVRELEIRLEETQAWIHRPKPTLQRAAPTDIDDRLLAIERQELMYEMAALALQTDSTRVITYQLAGLNAVPVIPGVSSDWHGLSHHGRDPEKISELRLIEEAEFAAFGRFLQRLRNITEAGVSLLDQTAVLFGANLGNASAHDWHNLPIVVAGGGFRHGSYTAHDAQQNTPLANLFVSLAHWMQTDIRQFGSSTAESVRGLDLAPHPMF